METDDLEGAPPRRPEAEPAGLHLIRDALARLRFGAIQLTVHEGKLVQIDITERTRLPA